jgi:hypothetical protein
MSCSLQRKYYLKSYISSVKYPETSVPRMKQESQLSREFDSDVVSI